MSNQTLAQDNSFFGHPKGLAYLFFAELWERFSFYGMRALLMLYMADKIFAALANTDVVSAIVYASYGSLVYASTVPGGRIADKILGYRHSILLGGILMTIGHFVLALDGDMAFFGGLAFIICGNGFFKPNISTFVGSLYPKGDVRKDSGFTIFYMGINIGAAAAPILCGWLAAKYGWHYGFGVAGIGMLTGLLVFWNGIRTGVFHDKGLPPSDEAYNGLSLGIPKKNLVTILAFLAVVPVAYLLSSFQYITEPTFILGQLTIVRLLFYILGVVILFYLLWVMIKLDPIARWKLMAAVVLTIFMTLFWGFHELSGGVITLFASRNVNLVLFDAAQQNSLNAIWIIVLSIPFGMLWAWLSKKNLNPRTPYKYALGLFAIGIGFYLLSYSEAFVDSSFKVPMMYLVIMYFLMSAGELCMSPVGLSKMTDLAPKNMEAFMMGIWFLASAFAFVIVGIIGEKLSLDKIESAGGSGTSLEGLRVYMGGFENIAYICLGGAAAILLLSPLMKRWMKDVH